jgi:hypothetical protein
MQIANETTSFSNRERPHSHMEPLTLQMRVSYSVREIVSSGSCKHYASRGTIRAVFESTRQ